MKKFFINSILLIFILLIILTAILTTIGVETNKFNKLIAEKISQTKNIKLELNTIKFKIDLKQVSLFLETQNPNIIYKNISVPVRNIKIYINFASLLKSTPKVKKTHIVLEELNISQLNKLSLMIKPSNFKSLLNNKIKDGKLLSEIEIFFSEKGEFKNFITKGKIKSLKIELFKGLSFTEVNLNFFADKNDILIQSIFGNLEDIKITDGDIKLNFENGIKFNSNFKSKINLDKQLLKKYTSFLKEDNFTNKINNVKAEFSNDLSINFDNTYKVKDYNYSIYGKLEKGKLEFPTAIKSSFLNEQIKEIFLSDLQLKTIFAPKKISFKGSGKYSFNNLDFLKIKLDNNIDKNILDLKVDFDLKKYLQIDLINYKKPKNTIANISIDVKKKDNNISINKIDYNEGNNLIKIENLKFKDNKFDSFKKVKVSTSNNDFLIQSGKKISIKGSKFDASNLFKYLDTQEDESLFEKLNNDIEIDFKDIKVPMSERLQNFKLLGKIKKGKFIKISSKGDFGDNNFLDISMKKAKDSEKKFLEIYSDLTRPLLTEYNFFNGLSGGKLLFTSIIDGEKSNSKLKIENFKVVNAPGVVKLLSLADLGGLADLAEGDGLSFDILEIDMEKRRNFLKLNEILALGPSISVLIEGYQDENGLTSLRGTLVPAKTFNKIISKIPVIGNIVIPKDVGEGLFGISFKMKGPKGKIKTTINPIRTLTPRFIQKIIDRNKDIK